MEKNLFDILNKINVNDKTEEVEGLTYLSWAWAWSEFKKACPDAEYEVVKNEVGLPYFHDPATGYMVYTRVTAGGQTYEMWLPVMNKAHKAMKAEPYQYQTKYGPKSVEAATMTDINKTVMRCLTKNLAMFGLGLYIYAGEDLPEGEEPEEPKKAEKKPEAKKPEAKPEPKPVKSSRETFEERARADYGEEFKSLLAFVPNLFGLINVDDIAPAQWSTCVNSYGDVKRYYAAYLKNRKAAAKKAEEQKKPAEPKPAEQKEQKEVAEE